MAPAYRQIVVDHVRAEIEARGFSNVAILDIASNCATLHGGLIDFATEHLDTAGLVGVLLSTLIIGNDATTAVSFASPHLRKMAEHGDASGLADLTNYIFKPLAIHQVMTDDLGLRDRVVAAFHRLHRIANDALFRVASPSRHYGAVRAELTAALDRADVPSDSAVHFTFLTEEYIDNFRTWIRAYAKSGALGHLVVLVIGPGFEADVAREIAAAQVATVSLVRWQPQSKPTVCGNGLNLNFLWFVKVFMVNHLVSRGNNVVYSDLDSYWLKDFPLLQQSMEESGVGCVFMQTGDLPIYGVQKWGFTPCAGFFGIRGGGSVATFVGNWLRMTEVMFDDQIGLFELLDEESGEWQPSGQAILDHLYVDRSGGYLDGKVAVLRKDVALRSAAVDPAAAVRELSGLAGCAVWHPRWAVAGDMHADVLRILQEIP